MDRRDLLKWSAVASVGGSGCASLISNPGAVGQDQMPDFLAALDGTMATLGKGNFLGDWLGKSATPSQQQRATEHEDLVRKTFRSMFLVGTLRELDEKQQAHEGVQQRLNDSMGEFDDAVFGMTSLLENLPAEERARVSKVLRDDPDVGMRIMGAIDQEAAGHGISLKQRARLRTLSAQACGRLRQSPELAISEYTAKVRKLEARHGSQAELTRGVAAAASTAMLFQQAEGEDPSGRGVVGGPSPLGAEQSVGQPCATDADCREGLVCLDHQQIDDTRWSNGACGVRPRKSRPSKAVLTAGGIVMGVAVTSFGIIGLVSGGAGFGWAIAGTVGAIIGIIGLIVLIVGLIMLATGN